MRVISRETSVDLAQTQMHPYCMAYGGTVAWLVHVMKTRLLQVDKFMTNLSSIPPNCKSVGVDNEGYGMLWYMRQPLSTFLHE